MVEIAVPHHFGAEEPQTRLRLRHRNKYGIVVGQRPKLQEVMQVGNPEKGQEGGKGIISQLTRGSVGRVLKMFRRSQEREAEDMLTDPLSRREVEGHLLERFKEELAPLDPQQHAEVIKAHKDGNFAMSFWGLSLYGNGHNVRDNTSEHPHGLLYNDGENAFGVSYFRKEDPNDPVGYMHIVAPSGPSATEAVNRFVDQSRERGSQAPVYVRHLNEAQYKELLALGFQPIESSPWHPEAPMEDETHQHQLITLSDIVELDENGGIQVKNLPLNHGGHKRHRSKTRLAHNRFNGFLNRNNMNLEIGLWDGLEDEQAANELVNGLFRTLEARGKRIGSSPGDYRNILDSNPAGVNGEDYIKLVGYLNADDGSVRLPALFYAGERIDETTMALYANFSNRNPDILPEGIDPKGFSALSQYSYVRVLAELKRRGITHVNLGGSETLDLDTFKRQLGAREVPSHWVFKP